jgi:hypothetical protein
VHRVHRPILIALLPAPRRDRSSRRVAAEDRPVRLSVPTPMPATPDDRPKQHQYPRSFQFRPTPAQRPLYPQNAPSPKLCHAIRIWRCTCFVILSFSRKGWLRPVLSRCAYVLSDAVFNIGEVEQRNQVIARDDYTTRPEASHRQQERRTPLLLPELSIRAWGHSHSGASACHFTSVTATSS